MICTPYRGSKGPRVQGSESESEMDGDQEERRGKERKWTISRVVRDAFCSARWGEGWEIEAIYLPSLV